MFIRGINYWPINKAMYWWKQFNQQEVIKDFQQISPTFTLVRIFLLWEDFQPKMDQIDQHQLQNLKTVADIAGQQGLSLMPTFFCGHMSGVNWMPDWILEPSSFSQRFPVYSNEKIVTASIRNFYAEPDLIQAQLYQIQTVCRALAGHPAIFAYDLGNEPSNCVQPPDRNLAQAWLKQMCQAVHEYSGGTPVTLGMHAEDLEENRQLWPQDAAKYCDFLSMHGYPFYLDWTGTPLDTDLVPFLGLLTAHLGEKEVLFQEFGAPTNPVLQVPDPGAKEAYFSETDVTNYYSVVLEDLQSAGMLGGMAWCFADYSPDLWELPPLKNNLHERYFGLFRHDGTPKPIVNAFKEDPVKRQMTPRARKEALFEYLKNIDRDHFYDQPRETIARLFAEYKNLCKGK